MKSFIKIILFSAGLFLLSGCINPFAQIQDSEVQEAQNVYKDRQITCDMLKNEGDIQNCYSAVNELAAGLLMNEILETFDLNRCNELPDRMIDQCIQNIELTGVKGPISQSDREKLINALDFVSSEEADVLQCDDFEKEDLKTYCKNKYTESKESLLMQQIIDVGDASACDSLTIESLKQDCILQISLKKGPDLSEIVDSES